MKRVKKNSRHLYYNHFLIFVIILISFVLCVNCITYEPPVQAATPPTPLTPPNLSGGSVTPSSGDTTTLFTYQVTYQDNDNDTPLYVQVYIDGFGNNMAYVSGSYQTGALYRYQTTLSAGNHYYYFVAHDGGQAARDPNNGTYQGPYVSGPGSSNYTKLFNGGVTPQSGNPSTVFTYQVTYNNTFNYPPISKYVYIDGTPYTMNYISGSFTQGAIYRYQTTLGVGNHTYYFYFNNTNGYARLPIYGAYYGPAVTYGGGSTQNNAPTLSNGFVDPQYGTPNTIFTFQVTYTDADNDPPVIKSLYIDNVLYVMNYTSGSYYQGAIYQYTTPLALGNHTYYFYFTDGNGSVRLPRYGNFSGPVVTSSAPPNSPPNLYYGYVSPNSGTPNTIFTYQVTYSDNDGDPPTLKFVYIDGLPYVMNHVTGNFTTGAVYRYTTALSVGNHTYYFYFSDGKNSSRLPTQGSYSGPSVTSGGPPSNNAPTLYYGTVTPQSGNITTKFTYQVYYRDLDGDPPTTKYVYIDGMAYSMYFVSGAYQTNAIYQYNTTLPGGNHTYYFYFSDGKASVRLPQNGSYNGPTVNVPGGPNNASQLLNGSVTPTTGNISTLFTYQVTYKDLDNDTPVIKRVIIDNQGYTMNYVSGNFTTGAIYQYKTKLSLGKHTYYFYFSDGKSTVRLPVNGTYSGPNVTGPPPNKLPILYSASLFPSSGTPSTVFTYQVIYRDLDNDQPSIKYIYIDGTPYGMNYKYGPYSLGALYEYKTSLNVGVHNYYFYFSDGKATVRLPLSGVYPGPIVLQPNRPPIADAGQDQTITVGPPKTVYLDGTDSYDPDNDTLIYYWDFMDGDYAMGANVSHIFHGVGDYYVSLTIWDGEYLDRDYCIIHVIDSGQGKTKGKAPEKHPLPGFEGFALIIALGGITLILHLKRRRK